MVMKRNVMSTDIAHCCLLFGNYSRKFGICVKLKIDTFGFIYASQCHYSCSVKTKLFQHIWWTTLMANFSTFEGFCTPSESRFDNKCISAKYCLILTHHTVHLITAYLLSFPVLNFEKCTHKTVFVVQGHIQYVKFTNTKNLSVSSPSNRMTFFFL